jgi:hypothetical protein
MQIEDIEKDLMRRVQESASWLESDDPLVIDGLEARDTPCTATAISLISDKKRKESDGVKFHLEFGKSDRRYSAVVEVRIKSTSSATRDGSGLANGPYVSVYVVDTKSQKGDLSYFEALEDANAYFRSVDDSIQEWYKMWLRRLLRLHKGATVFKYMKDVSNL